MPGSPLEAEKSYDRSKLGSPSLQVSWALQIIAAAILGQTLFFKFSGAPESIYIFSKLGAEPWGRLGTGAAELVAAVLLLTPWQPVLGAVLAAGLMTGAIGSHLGPLGIDVQGDHGLLFTLGIITFLSAMLIIALRRRQLANLLRRFAGRGP